MYLHDFKNYEYQITDIHNWIMDTYPADPGRN